MDVVIVAKRRGSLTPGIEHRQTAQGDAVSETYFPAWFGEDRYALSMRAVTIARRLLLHERQHHEADRRSVS